jgi:uncharacterized protein
MTSEYVKASPYIETGRCRARTTTGKRCGKRTTIYPQFCCTHTKSEIGLYLKTSTVPGAGLGLFTVHDIEPDRLITPYIGDVISADEYESRDNGYGLEREDGMIVDASSTQSCIARYANMCLPINIERDGCNGNNSVFEEYEGELWVVSTKHIKANEEIFAHYGLEYWGENSLKYA